MKLLKELCETAAIPGREQQVIDIMMRELKPLTDKVSVDSFGNVIGYRKGNGKNPLKVMIAGHMDEIGFIVSYIDKNGFIRFAPRGGHIPRVLISQRVKILGKKEITGVVEGAPPLGGKPEDRSNAPDFKNLFIDTGLSEKEVRKIIDIGDIIVLDRTFIEQGDICISKAFDDRIGCYVLLEAMKRLENVNVDVYAVGTAQEEVGIRGASGAAKEINPDIGIAVDITGAFDVPGVPEHQQVTKLGDGVAIKINDNASISNHGIVEFMKKSARKQKIKYQMEVLPFGGTDAAGMQRFGKGAVCTLSLPTRHAHTPNEMVHKGDVESAIALLVEFLKTAEKCLLAF